VLAIDLAWSILLERVGRPLFVGLFPGQSLEANRLLDRQLMPLLWISYGIVLSAQIGWLTWASHQQKHWPRNASIPVSLKRLRLAWWSCAFGQLGLSIVMQLVLAAQLGWGVNPAGFAFVLALLFCDLLVIFWLPTALLIPDELRRAIPVTKRFDCVHAYRQNH